MGSTIETLIQIGVIKKLVLNFYQQAPLPVEPLERAAHVLAGHVFRQWREEAIAWDVVKPEPMRIRWKATWPDPGYPHKVGDEASGSDGRVATMADAFLALKHQRLAILGESGAGKTTMAVLLALDLLARRRDATDPGQVPVIFRLETWDPERDHLRAWLGRQISEAYPGLPRIDGRSPAALLVADRKVLPVLDGLDELTPSRQDMVIKALNDSLGADDSLILVSGSVAYREAVARVGVISSAAVVEALPVEGPDSVAYLASGRSADILGRWESVFEELMESPPQPVAGALSSPLMLWLARRVYEPPHTEPVELTDKRRFPTPASIEEHLLDQLVPTVFARAPRAPDRMHPPRMWNPVRARRWLNFLAAHLTRRQTLGLAWWHLHRDRLVVIVAGLVLLTACLTLAWTAEGLATWLLDGAWSGSGSASAHPGPKLAFGTGLTLAGMLLVIQRFWFRRHDGQPRRLANPFRIGAALRSASRAASLGRTLRAASMVVLPTAVFTAFALTTPYAAPLLLATLCSTVLPPLVLAVISAPSDAEDAGSPDDLMWSERRALLLSLGTIAPIIGVGQGAIDWFAPEESRAPAISALFGWFGAAVMLVLFSPWTRWFVAKAVLATWGKVPWSLMEFLRDAHTLGLMQRGGGVYLFRNRRLQEHFAGQREGLSIEGTPPPPVPRQRDDSAYEVPEKQGRGRGVSGAGPAHRVRLLPKLWQGPGDADRTPLAERPGWTTHEDDNSFRVWGTHRVFPVGHWNTVVLASAVTFTIYAVDGSWRTGLRFIVFWFVVGLAAMLTGFLRKRLTLDLCLTRDYLTYAVGRRSGVIPWRDISIVEVSKYSQRGWKAVACGVVISLHPGVPTPSRALRAGDGRYLVLPLLSPSPAVPLDLAAALTRFAGALWQSSEIDRGGRP